MVERDRRLDPFDDGHLQRAPHARDRFLSIRAVRDDLGDQRVVIGLDRALGVNERIDSNARPTRHTKDMYHPGRWDEGLWALGVDAAFDRVASHRDVALLERQPFARRDSDLLLDHVDAGDHLGDRVLDLQPGIGLHEVEVSRLIHQEFERFIGT